MKGRATLFDWVMLVSLVLLFSSSFLFTKIAASSFPSATGVAFRVIIASVFVVTISIGAGYNLPPAKHKPSGRLHREWAFFVILGIIGNALPFTISFWALRTLDAGMGGNLMAIMPLTTLGLAHFFVPGEHMTWPKAAGFLLGFIGLMILFVPETDLSQGTLLPKLALLASAICYAVNSIIARHLPPMSPIRASAGILPCAAIFLIPVAIFMDGTSAFTLIPEHGAVASLLILAFFTTAVATVVYMKLIATAGPSFMSLTNYLVPLATVSMGAYFFSERLPGSAFIALVVILSGIAITQLDPSRVKFNPTR